MAPRKKQAAKKAKKEETKKTTVKVEGPEVRYMKSLKGAAVQVPKMIVLHAMGEFVENVFAVDFLKSVGFSVHAMITPAGSIIRCRDDDEGAYHAGDFNTDSLGVEFLVEGSHNWSSFLAAIQNKYLTDKQYETGVYLVKQWLAKHKIEKVTTHSSLSPARKFDPGPGFPLKQFEKDIGVKIK